MYINCLSDEIKKKNTTKKPKVHVSPSHLESVLSFIYWYIKPLL